MNVGELENGTTPEADKKSPVKPLDYLLMAAFILAIIIAVAGAVLTSGFFIPE